MAKKGKVLGQKKMLQPLLGTPEGIHSGCIIIFSTSAPSAVYPTEQLHSADQAPNYDLYALVILAFCDER